MTTQKAMEIHTALFSPVILCDKGGKCVAEVLHRHIGKGVDFYSGGKGGHHNGAEAVDKPLHHKDAEVHDRLLHAGQRGEGDDLPDAPAPQATDLPYRTHLCKAHKRISGDADPRNILGDHRCLRRPGNAPIMPDDKP